jgi:hypothetical protein
MALPRVHGPTGVSPDVGASPAALVVDESGASELGAGDHEGATMERLRHKRASAPDHREPESAPALDKLMALQRTAGNAAVARMLGARQRPALARLRVGSSFFSPKIDALTEAGVQQLHEWTKVSKVNLSKDEEEALAKRVKHEPVQMVAPAMDPQLAEIAVLLGEGPGAQLGVQKKMVEIIKLVRERAFPDLDEVEEEPQAKSETTAIEDTPETEGDDNATPEDTDTTKEYLKELVDNGLCGGWATLFMQHPEWSERVYNAVATWSCPPSVVGAEALRHFEKHLSTRTQFSGAENVVELIRRVYQAMDRLEPGKYKSLPKWTDHVQINHKPELGETVKGTARHQESTLRLNGRNAAKLVCTKLEELTAVDKKGECMAHIESEKHHMAVRVQKTERKKPPNNLGLLITVVETEKKGFVKVDSWDKAERILNGWLAEEAQDDEQEPAHLRELDLTTATIGF